MTCTHIPSRVAAFAVLVAVAAGICGARIPTASAAQQESASANIQLDVVVTASGGDEGAVETPWRVTSTAMAGQSFEVQFETTHVAATPYLSNDGSITLDDLRVTVGPIDAIARIQGLALKDGEATVVLQSSDPAHGSVAIEVTATTLERPRRPEASSQGR